MEAKSTGPGIELVEVGIQAHSFLRGKLVLITTQNTKGKIKYINQIIKDTKELIQKYSIMPMGHPYPPQVQFPPPCEVEGRQAQVTEAAAIAIVVLNASKAFKSITT